ncbi:MAG: penicillin-insensitive murein endopeptidase [Nannocystaceae bacterium]|nr:penicillin-insensitive murein endopeptidase [Nannocystaceae bacterium]
MSIVLCRALLLLATSATAEATTAIPIVHDAASLFVARHDVPQLAAPTWQVHPLRPRDSIARVAARYGVSATALRRWNRLDAGEEPASHRRTLAVLSDRTPPPPRRIAYVVQAGEDWDDVAAKLRLSARALRASAPRRTTLAAGSHVLAWIDPLEGPSFEPDAPDIDAAMDIAAGGRSVGLPQRGRLEQGVRLPDSPLWTQMHPTRAFGSSHTIETVRRAFAILRNDIGYRGGVTIGALSRPHGGRFPPHRSHQSGRDIDVRLPLRPGLEDVRHPRADDIDWYAAWAIIDAFLRTGEVEAIFLELGRHEKLYTAARALGVERERLHGLLRWGNWNGDVVVRHSDGHDTHVHIRIRCGADEPRCRSQGRDGA